MRDDELTRDDIQKQWPGFDVICDCGSSWVVLENDLGFSEINGAWGSVDLRCLKCGRTTEIVSS